MAANSVYCDRFEPRPKSAWTQVMLKIGKALEKGRQDFLHDVVDGVGLRYVTTYPTPAKGLVNKGELTPSIGVVMIPKPIQKAERGIRTGHGRVSRWVATSQRKSTHSTDQPKRVVQVMLLKADH